ncbi:hypothetical protein LCL97_08500 [Seohaeicola saemankumensis]|nr:hypothetical protein [Seohaeicola saemankumensis]MCA0870861.1 hypothetical protein [Seohaeicola saemankumensis]
MSFSSFRFLILSAALSGAAYAPVHADECRDTIAALYQGGALDPFERPKRREVTVSVQPDGSESLVTDVIWDSVTRSVALSGGTYYLTFDGEMWSGPSFEGPWTPTGSSLPEDFEQMTRQMADQSAANITEAQCPGQTEVGGNSWTTYVYRTKTDPNVHGSWFGGLHTAYIDPASGELARLEIAEMVSSWAPDPTAHKNVTTVSYDPSVAVIRPE